MNFSIGSKIALGFALALGVLVAIGATSYNQLRQLNDDSTWVDHTFIVQRELQALIADVSRAESSARGYQLLNDPTLQSESDQAATRAQDDLVRLRDLTKDNSLQQGRLDKLNPLIAQRLDLLRRLVTPGETPAGTRDTAIRDGETYMDQVRQLIGDMQNEENTLLDQRRTDETRMSSLAHATLAYGTIAAFVLIGGAGLLITWSITRPLRVLADGAARLGGGDYTHRVLVKSRDEVGDLSRHFNRMAEQVQERQNSLAEQDWLKTGLTRINALFQGLRDPAEVCRTVLTELASLVGARNSALYVTGGESTPVLKLQATYASDGAPEQIAPGDGLVGQCYLDRQRILLNETPADYFRINSALGAAPPRVLLLQPCVYENQVRAVIELALLQPPTATHLSLIERVAESLGIVLNTIAANQRTEELLGQSQDLAVELSERNRDLRNSELMLQEQQEELKQTNEELEQTNEELQQTNEEIEEKANLLAAQKKEVEKTNREIEQARIELQQRAEQIAQTSRYKSEFLANMSHELRTPLNSLLILSKILAENHEGNLTEKQVQYAGTIQSSGHDLLELINEVLDLSRIESGAVELETAETRFSDISHFVESTFRPVAETKHLEFATELDPRLPSTLTTDQRRVEQILKNLLSNAFKFTEQGSVRLKIAPATDGWDRDNAVLNNTSTVLAFSITDTGIGIPEEKQKLIFEAFQQADAGTARKYGGTGLGLSISRELAALLGGSLKVASRVGAGSTFTLFLPGNLRRAAKTHRHPETHSRSLAGFGRGPAAR